MTRKEAKARIPEVLDRVGILDRSRQLIGHLSRGLRQRAGLAVALLPKPEVLILDEPTSGLDPLQRLEVRKLIEELAQEHTVLLSSHILPEVEAVCPRVIIIHKGKIAADGTPDALVRELSGQSHVKLDAVCGDVAEATRLLSSLPGVLDVRGLGRLGIHEQFEILCEDDLREDVGALAMQRGWALRELSFTRPSLEELFARIALDLDDGEEREPVVAASAPEALEQPSGIEVQSPGLELAAPTTAAPATTAPVQETPAAKPAKVLNPFEQPPPKKEVYNLNPFEQGAARDLSKPKPNEDEA